MNCKYCSTSAQTLTTWSGRQTDEGKPVIYDVWKCEQGHHFYTQRRLEGMVYKTEYVELRDMHFVKPLL